MKKAMRVLITLALGLVGVCLLAALVSTLSNLGLPTRLKMVDRLPELEKNRLREAFQLRRELGERVWPGWGKADIPILVYNSDYAFLVGYPDPPPGWLKVPSATPRGGPWEQTPDDTFQGQVYYRQRLTEPGITPEAFTVRVGDRWVASLGTREYAQISLIQGFRETLPGLLKPIFPYRLLWKLLMGDTETYIGALLHEAFHAYQGMAAPERLAQAENSMRYDSQYPWDNAVAEQAWQTELNKLFEATQAQGKDPTIERARQFLALRDARRAQAGLTTELIDLERMREWEEGLAKYAELEIQRQAALSANYRPLPALAQDPDFKHYKNRLSFWNNQLNEVKRMGNRSEDTRFYYSGFAQAVLLDRLMPGWKARAFQPGVWLEDLLREAAY